MQYQNRVRCICKFGFRRNWSNVTITSFRFTFGFVDNRKSLIVLITYSARLINYIIYMVKVKICATNLFISDICIESILESAAATAAFYYIASKCMSFFFRMWFLPVFSVLMQLKSRFNSIKLQFYERNGSDIIESIMTTKISRWR